MKINLNYRRLRSFFRLISDYGVLDVTEDARNYTAKSASIFCWSICWLDLDLSLLVSEYSRLFYKSFLLNYRCLDILFDDWRANLRLYHRFLNFFGNDRFSVFLINDLAVLFVNDGFVNLMNDIFVLLVNHWLMNFLNHLLINNGLIMFMYHWLMMFMNNVLMMFMHNLLMMFVKDFRMMFLDYGCIDVGLHPGCLRMLYHTGTFSVSFQSWFFFVFENLRLLEGRLHDRLFLCGLDHCRLLLSCEIL